MKLQKARFNVSISTLGSVGSCSARLNDKVSTYALSMFKLANTGTQLERNAPLPKISFTRNASQCRCHLSFLPSAILYYTSSSSSSPNNSSSSGSTTAYLPPLAKSLRCVYLFPPPKSPVIPLHALAIRSGSVATTATTALTAIIGHAIHGLSASNALPESPSLIRPNLPSQLVQTQYPTPPAMTTGKTNTSTKNQNPLRPFLRCSRSKSPSWPSQGISFDVYSSSWPPLQVSSGVRR